MGGQKVSLHLLRMEKNGALPVLTCTYAQKAMQETYDLIKGTELLFTTLEGESMKEEGHVKT